jgi:hypothetical protein
MKNMEEEERVEGEEKKWRKNERRKGLNNLDVFIGHGTN